MIECRRRLTFCAGHRVMGHENKCAHLHGHNYTLLVHARARDLDSVGRVIDFAELKARVGGWIDTHWDHGFLLHAEDTAGQAALSAFRAQGLPQKTFLLPTNPTAENLAAYLLETVCPQVLASTGIAVCSITLWETENCSAIVSTD